VESAFEYQEREPFDAEEIFRTEELRGIMRELTGFSQDFEPPLEGDPDSPNGYFWKNGMFSYSDAMSYYAMIRRVRPRTIVEIGSGFSSLVAREALRRNGAGRLVCIEPFPSKWLRRLPGIELIEKPAQAIPAAFFNETLADGDILFIDSTHTVKVGSDCLHLYLRVLPGLTRDLAFHGRRVHARGFDEDLGPWSGTCTGRTGLLLAYCSASAARARFSDRPLLSEPALELVNSGTAATRRRRAASGSAK
jgi:hypothetical protein